MGKAGGRGPLQQASSKVERRGRWTSSAWGGDALQSGMQSTSCPLTSLARRGREQTGSHGPCSQEAQPEAFPLAKVFFEGQKTIPEVAPSPKDSSDSRCHEPTEAVGQEAAADRTLPRNSAEEALWLPPPACPGAWLAGTVDDMRLYALIPQPGSSLVTSPVAEVQLARSILGSWGLTAASTHLQGLAPDVKGCVPTNYQKHGLRQKQESKQILTSSQHAQLLPWTRLHQFWLLGGMTLYAKTFVLINPDFYIRRFSNTINMTKSRKMKSLLTMLDAENCLLRKIPGFQEG